MRVRGGERERGKVMGDMKRGNEGKRWGVRER